MTRPQTEKPATRLPAGIGLRAVHVAALVASRPPVGFLEVHAENYMAGGAAPRRLEVLRRDWPISLHGVGLSLGSAELPDRQHLKRLVALARRVDPLLISEHLAWSRVDGCYLNDLLPLPYSEEALTLVARNVGQMQDALRRQVLIENPSSYLRFASSTIPESEFLAELVRRTGCGLLCDVNNVYVSCTNLGGDPIDWLDGLPAGAVGEIHLAGHHRTEVDGVTLLIDDHGGPVAPAVWALYRHAVARFPHATTLLEWDSNLPALDVLVAEAKRAELQRDATFTGGTHAAAA